MLLAVIPTIRARCFAVAYSILLPMTFAAEMRQTAAIEPRDSSPQPSEARALSLRGDVFFRNAEFERAEQFYLEAAEADPNHARAHLGLGRLARLQFRRKAAGDSFATAFRLDSRDPDILLAYSEYVSDPRARAELYAGLRGLTELQDSRIQGAIARLQIDKALGSRRLNRLAGPYRSYRLKLSPFLPANSTPNGVVLKVSLNGSKPLRLVLDTGAKGVIVSERSVRDLGLEVIAESRIGGLGISGLKAAHVALADSVSVADFRLENCLVEITDEGIVSGADGIIGTDVFQEFLLRLDIWSYVLELLPFPDHVPGPDNSLEPWFDSDPSPKARRAPFTPAFHVGHLLAVQTAVDGRGNGLFVVDTGSAYDSVSPELLCNVRQTASGLIWRGAQGAIRTRIATSPAEFRVSGGPGLNDTNVVVLDLADMSQKEGAKISGLLGYSTLSKLALTINYRDGVVQFVPRSQR